MRYPVFFIALLLSSIVFGQNTASISGMVTDHFNKQPLAYANALLKDENGALLHGTITDETGHFLFTDLQSGTYLLQIEYIGYTTEKLALNAKAGERLELPAFVLKEEAEALEGVTVSAQKSTIEQHLDRKVVHVGNDLISQGPSATDIMNNLPSVNVGSDGNISFRGSENVRILVDGKLSNLENPADVLQQIPSNSIKRVELITNPSAKFNPDGLNGMINIILKKTTGEGWNSAFGANSIIAQRERYNSNLSLNFKPNTSNYYLEYSNGFGDQITDGTVRRFDLNSNQVTQNVNNRESHFIKLGADFYPSQKTIFSLFTTQNLYDGTFDGNKEVIFEGDAASNFGLNDLLTRDSHTQNYNGDFKWLIDGSTHVIEVEANYNRFKSDLINDFDFYGNTTTPSYLENIDDIRSVLTANLDYTLPLGSNTKIGLGGEARINRIENGYTSTNATLENSNFSYNRDILSSYLMYNGTFGKLSMNAGIRLEDYRVNALFNQERSGPTVFTQRLSSLFPSLSLSYKASEESPHQYQLSYGKRIERPSFSQVNPIRRSTTPQLVSTGNIDLLPQFSNTLEASHLFQFNNGSISSGIFYRYVQDEINRIGVFDQDDPNLLRLSYDNFDSNNAFGMEVGGNLRLTHWWKTNINVELYHRQQRGLIEAEAVEVQNTLTNIKWNHSYDLGDRIKASLFAFYSGPQEILQYRLKSNYYINAGLRYTFANGKGSVNISANDLLGTRRFAFETYRTVFQEGEFLRDTQQLSFGLTYRMGGKLPSRSRKKRSNNIKADRFL